MTWWRLEAGNIDPEMTAGIAARVADPLWMLTRQWQVGEFHGEDAASPVLLSTSVETIPITGVRLGSGTMRTITQTVPLETLVEAESVSDGPASLLLRLESGQALLSLLRSDAETAIAAALLHNEYVLPPDSLVEVDDLDPVGRVRLNLLVRRSIDAAAVVRDLDDAGGATDAFLSELGVRAAGYPAVRAAIDQWLQTEERLAEEPPAGESSWVRDRLEYRFAVRAAGESTDVLLTADEYRGGTIEWYEFDVGEVRRLPKPPPAPGPTKPAPTKPVLTKPNPNRVDIEVLASPIQFAGQPASRWWEFEDGDVDFGDLGGGPEDLARSVVGSFAAVAGDDWFVIPATLPVGSLARAGQVTILDDFGGVTIANSTAVQDVAAGNRTWRFFELAGDESASQGVSPMLFLPPVMDTVELGRPLEAVEFRRDEMANLAWAIERRVESAAGRPVDRDATISPPNEPEAGVWSFTLMTEVPDSWVPLVPVRMAEHAPEIVLRRGRIAHPHANAGRSRTGTDPRSVVLDPENPFYLQEEEIPSGGIRVTRRWQMARDHGGRVRLWVGRKKSPSSGPMRRTPLKFDRLRGYRQPPTTSDPT